MLDYQLEKPVHGSIGTGNYQCSIEWRNGHFISDEPVKSGGKDEGPDPYTLLVSSLITCTLVTLRMYIQRKGWDIPVIGVNGNLYQARTGEKTITVVDRDIRFGSPVSDEQRNRLTEIAEHCPVSKILEGEIKVRTFSFSEGSEIKPISYSNDDITVHWKPSLCKHSGRCVTGLSGVFNLKTHPWVNMLGAPTVAIMNQVHECPTGALTYISTSNERTAT